MRYLGSSFLGCLLAWLLVPAGPAAARIGESKSTLQTRLFGIGALAYKEDAIIDARSSKMPYDSFRSYIDPVAELVIYHKTSDGERRKRSEFDARRMPAGWDLHVFYVNGISAAEFYVRSRQITDEEANLLLVLQGGGKNWTRREQDGRSGAADADGVPQDPEQMTAFGFTMLRNDGEVRGNRFGANMMGFFDAEFDSGLAQRQAEERLRGAPESVEGF